MSGKSKVCFVLSAVLFLVMCAIYFMLGVWIPFLSLILMASVGLIAAAVIWDWRLYFEFFTLRTTKHGMNMGLLILLALTGLVCINYLGVRTNKTFDLTAEQANSLSDQTKKIINEGPAEILVNVFYKGPIALDERGRISRVVDLYKDYSSKVKVRYFNTYVDVTETQAYLESLADKDSAKAFVFVEVDGKRLRVESPFEENQITGAILKSTRRSEKKVYFLSGHGERDLQSENPDGLKSFKEALEGQAFKVETLNLLEKNEIPKDADFIAIVGPKTAFLEHELTHLKTYAAAGGRLLIAIDPGQRHNLSGFVRNYGIEFMNNYVISLSQGGYTSMAVGLVFSPQSQITQTFQAGRNAYAVFELASQIKPAVNVPNGLKVTEIVSSSPMSIPVADLTKQVTAKDLPDAQSYPLALEVTGRLDKDADGKVTETNASDEKAKQFKAVVYGDSDFLSNQSILLGVNRDLALNTAADLAHEMDLIGIRAKSYKGTVLELGRYQAIAVVVLGIGFPIFLLLMSGVMWYRRRGA